MGTHRRKEALIATPPGATIKELIENQNVDIEVFCETLNISIDEYQALLDGELAIDSSMAESLSKALGPSADFWLLLEEQYRDKLSVINGEDEYSDEKFISRSDLEKLNDKLKNEVVQFTRKVSINSGLLGLGGGILFTLAVYARSSVLLTLVTMSIALLLLPICEIWQQPEERGKYILMAIALIVVLVAINYLIRFLLFNSLYPFWEQSWFINLRS